MPAVRRTGLGVSLCTVMAPDSALTDTGASTQTYSPVAGLINLQCQDAPDAVDRFTITSLERKSQYDIESMELRHVLLYSYYPQLSPSTNWGNVGWQAVIDGNTYDILAAEQDSQKTQTRLRLRKVTL